MDLQAFYAELSAHDWHYDYLTGTRYREGVRAHARIVELSKLSQAHSLLFAAYHTHVFSGDLYGTPKAPVPPRPETLTDYGPQLRIL